MENFVCSYVPKGEVLRKIALRYPDMDPAALEVLMTLKLVAQTADETVRQELSKHGLSEGKFFILAFLMTEELQEHAHPTPSVIADNLGVTRATVTGLLDGLERDGLLERRHDTQDRRSLTICMSDSGRNLMDDLIPVQAALISRIVGPLNKDERNELLRLLLKLNSSLDE